VPASGQAVSAAQPWRRGASGYLPRSAEWGPTSATRRPLQLSDVRAEHVLRLWRGGAFDFDTRALHDAFLGIRPFLLDLILV
jgi:hypothetical protein